MSGKRVTGLVFIGIALADLAFAGAVALGRHQQFQGYRGAEAVVVDPRDAAPVRPGKPVNPPPPPPEPGTTPIVRFITAEDRVVMAPLDSGRFLRPPPPGSGRIAVLYDPADPQSVILDHPVPIYESALVVAAPSVPFLLIGLALRSGAMAPVPAAPPRRRAAAAAAPPPATPARQDAARKAAARATPLPVGQGGTGSVRDRARDADSSDEARTDDQSRRGTRHSDRSARHHGGRGRAHAPPRRDRDAGLRATAGLDGSGRPAAGRQRALVRHRGATRCSGCGR